MNLRLWSGVAVSAILAGAIAAPARDEQPVRPEPVGKQLDQGHTARARGDFEKAVNAYRAAAKLAEDGGQQSLEWEARLLLGDAYQEWASADKDPAAREARLREAEKAYRQVIDKGNARWRLLAQNNLGVFYLRQGKDKAGDAVRVFADMDLGTDLKAGQKAVYKTNHALALEKNDQPDEALRSFRLILDEQPRYETAAKEAFRLLCQKPTEKSIQEAVRLANDLLAKGQGDVAARQIKAGLEKWPNPHGQPLLTVLVRYYASSSLPPADFKLRESASLEAIRDRQPHLAAAVDEIYRAYFGELRPVFSMTEVREEFRAWSEGAEPRKAFAALLKATGDYYYRTSTAARDPARALTRYCAAWQLDLNDTEKALYVAAVLRDNARQLDPERQLYARFIDTLMEEKGERYKIPVKTRADWDNLLRLHSLLGTIFAQEEKWGSEYEPRSALFQWTRALKAEEELRRLDDKVAPAPSLHAQVADAYRATRQVEKAADHYLTAAEGFVRLKDRSSAKKTLDGARALKDSLSETQTRRLNQIEVAWADLEKSFSKP